MNLLYAVASPLLASCAEAGSGRKKDCRKVIGALNAEWTCHYAGDQACADDGEGRSDANHVDLLVVEGRCGRNVWFESLGGRELIDVGEKERRCMSYISLYMGQLQHLHAVFCKNLRSHSMHSTQHVMHMR